MGLLDFNLDNLDSPGARMGLGLLAAAGPQAVPMSFGQRLAGAMGQMRAEKAAEEERKLKAALMNAQIQDMAAQAKLREAQAAKSGEADQLLREVLGAQSAPSQYGMAGGGINLGGVQERMTPRAGGLAGATPEQIALLKLKGIDVTDQWKAAKNGFEQKPGTFYKDATTGETRYQEDPTKGLGYSGGRVSLIPGAAEAQAALSGAIKEADARASASWQPFVEQPPNGPPQIRGSIADAITRARQTAQGAPDDRQARIRELLTPDATFSSPAVRARVYQEAGLGGQPATQGGIPVGPSVRDKAYAESLTLGNQEFMKNRYAPALEAGDSASRMLASIEASRGALKRIGQTGWGTEAKGQVASILGAMGVKNAQDFAGDMQMFQSQAMGRLWETLNAAKGPQTEGDAERASKTWASVKNTPRANEFILDFAQAQAERDRAKAAYFRQALPFAQENGDLQEIERRWAEKHDRSIFDMPSMRKWAK